MIKHKWKHIHHFIHVITNTQLQVLFITVIISRINNDYTAKNDDTKMSIKTPSSPTYPTLKIHSGAQTCTMWQSATSKHKNMCTLMTKGLQNYFGYNTNFTQIHKKTTTYEQTSRVLTTNNRRSTFKRPIVEDWMLCRPLKMLYTCWINHFVRCFEMQKCLCQIYLNGDE